MTWDTISALSSTEVTQLQMEQNSLTLWKEFIEGYFNGQIHHVAGQSIRFPSVICSFQQGSLNQPFDNNVIAITWIKEGNPIRRERGDKRITYLKSNWTFYIKAGSKNVGGGSPDVVIKTVSDLLYGVLADRSLTIHLARKGIHHVKAGQPSLMGSPDMPMRKIEVKAELQFQSRAVSILATDQGEWLTFDDGSAWAVNLGIA